MCLRRAKNKQFKSILERFQKQDSYLESHVAIGWTEEKCICQDQLAVEDKSFTDSRRERQRYENNWKLTLNGQELVSPMNKREDYFEAVKAINNLRQQAEQTKQSSDLAELPDSTESIPKNVIEQNDTGSARHGYNSLSSPAWTGSQFTLSISAEMLTIAVCTHQNRAERLRWCQFVQLWS